MGLEEKARMLLEDISQLSPMENKFVRYAVATFKFRKLVKNETNEVLSDEYYAQLSLKENKVEMDLLFELLEKYLRGKGLKQSLLKAEELLHLIYQDKQRLQDDILDKRHTIENIQSILRERNQIADGNVGDDNKNHQ